MKQLYRQVAGLPSIQEKKRKVALQKERFDSMTSTKPDTEMMKLVMADDEQMDLEADILGTDRYFLPDFGKEPEKQDEQTAESLVMDALADDGTEDADEESDLA